MIAWLQLQGFWILCAYGILATVAFRACGGLQRSAVGAYVYASLYVLLFLFWAPVPISMGLVGLIIGLFQVGIILACNAVPIFATMEIALSQIGRGIVGQGQMVLRKSYDRASGAEARGELDLAAQLYREELKRDPDDLEARRRLAEVLLRCGRSDEAVQQLERVFEQAEQKEMRYSVAFRLAEVVAEEMGDAPAAENLYRLIVQEDPKSKYARYARARLGQGDASEAPTDS